MPATPESVVRSWFDELWNRGDETTIDRLLHADGVVHGLPTPYGRPIRGPVEFKRFYQAFRNAFPDISVELVHVLSQGEMVAAHCRVTGTHRGNTLGMAATNKAVRFEGFVLARITDGQLIEGWNCFDFMGMYQQLGVLTLNVGNPSVSG